MAGTKLSSSVCPEEAFSEIRRTVKIIEKNFDLFCETGGFSNPFLLPTSDKNGRHVAWQPFLTLAGTMGFLLLPAGHSSGLLRRRAPSLYPSALGSPSNRAARINR